MDKLNLRRIEFEEDTPAVVRRLEKMLFDIKVIYEEKLSLYDKTSTRDDEIFQKGELAAYKDVYEWIRKNK